LAIESDQHDESSEFQKVSHIKNRTIFADLRNEERIVDQLLMDIDGAGVDGSGLGRVAGIGGSSGELQMMMPNAPVRETIRKGVVKIEATNRKALTSLTTRCLTLFKQKTAASFSATPTHRMTKRRSRKRSEE
jgi:hypothetical protein